MRKITSLVAQLICCIVFNTNAQQLYFKHLSVNNGLSEGVNNCILKDSRGYIWITSFDGLNRFDGTDCIVYKDVFKDSCSIKGTLFLNILEDKNNNLWIGSNEGLNFYDRKLNCFKSFYSHDNNSTNKTCSPFYIDAQNNIWVQNGQDILLFDVSKNSFKWMYRFSANSNLIIKTLPHQQLQPLQKIILAVKGTADMYSTDVTNNNLHFTKIKDIPSSLAINTFCVDGQNYWLGTTSGLWLANASGKKLFTLTTKNQTSPNIITLHKENDSSIWIGTQKDGLYKLNPHKPTDQKQFLNDAFNPTSISGNQIQYTYPDNEQNLWVGIWGKGVDYVNLQKFKFQHYINKQDALKSNIDNFVRSIVEIKKNRFWCGTLLNGIVILDENKKIIKNISENLPHAIEHICKSSNEDIWISTLMGLFKANSNTESTKKFNGFQKYSAAAQQFNFMTELRNGKMLASTNGGVFFINKNNTIQQAKGIENNDVYSTNFEASTGDIYLCKAFKGFGVYSLSNDSFILKKEFFNQTTVKSYTETSDSILWIGTTKGLIKFNKKRLQIIKTYNVADGLKNDYIYSAQPGNNELWISTNAGISKFNTMDNTFKNFTVEDGLQSNEFNTYSFCKTAEGEYIFGGVNGINAFYPWQIKKDLSEPTILIQKLFVNDKFSNNLDNPEELIKLNLKYVENTVSFVGAVIDYNNPTACSFLYKLEGYDKDWIQASNKATIRYANLPPGNYTLLIKAVSAEGIISSNLKTLKINVQTPWHKSWWFTLMIIGLGALLVWYFIRNYYERKLEKQKAILEKQHAIEQERTRLARELHDGLGSMLSGIKHSFSSIKNNINLDTNQNKNFDTNIEKLNLSIKEIRNISHSMMDADSLLEHGLTNALKDYCNNINCPGKLEILFKEINADNLPLKETQAFHLLRIVQELLQNIIKHAQANKVIVQISCNEGIVYITVEDDGVGFNKAYLEKGDGIGLKNIAERLKIIKGKMDLQSEIKNGTSVLISCPLL